MQDKREPEPPVEQRACHYCGKRAALVGKHYPEIGAGEAGWLYECRWCRSVATKRRKAASALIEAARKEE